LVSRCEQFVDNCLSNPCVKGYCLNFKESFKCFCFSNYTGDRCDIKLTEVVRPCRVNYCLNGGDCVESSLMEGFKCNCKMNYLGVFCEHSLCSMKTGNKCNNNATCVLNDNSTIPGYLCKCDNGDLITESQTCQDNYNPCSIQNNKCLNSGRCVLLNNKTSINNNSPNAAKFRCRCESE
jgi:hypothetical protein